MVTERKKIDFAKQFLWVLLFLFVVLFGTAIGMSYYRYVRRNYAYNDAYRIIALLQTSPDEELLKTAYLSELLGLSIDKPVNLYRFNAAEGTRKLLAVPMIKEATVKKIRPGTIYVDYVLRQPIATLSDYANTLIDVEGFAFPHKPFFTPKRLPEICLGIAQEGFKSLSPQMCTQGPLKTKFELTQEILNYLNSYICSQNAEIKRIDVSSINSLSYGSRQIVVVLEDKVEREIEGRSRLLIIPRILRLDVQDYKQGLANYVELQKHLVQQEIKISQDNTNQCVFMPPMTIDLRLPHLAYISNL